jgi:integrase
VPTVGGCTFGPPKSARSRRTVALDAETVDVLRAHREAQILARAFAGDAYIDADLVFADELGGSIHPQRLTQWFGERRKAAGIPSGTLHVLRHTAATLALTSRCAASHRGRPARGRPEDRAVDVCAPVAAVERARGRAGSAGTRVTGH